MDEMRNAYNILIRKYEGTQNCGVRGGIIRR